MSTSKQVVEGEAWKALEGQASRCDLFLVEAWREGENKGMIFYEFVNIVPNVRQFTQGLWWSCEFVRRASGCGLKTGRFLGVLRARVEILEVSTRVWIWSS